MKNDKDKRALMIKGLISKLDLSQQDIVHEIKSQLEDKLAASPIEYQLGVDLAINDICFLGKLLLEVFGQYSSQEN